MTKEELLLEQWKIASELHRHENNLAWNRFSYFITLNGILLSVFGAIALQNTTGNIDVKLVSMLISAFGAIVSLAWTLMQIRGKLYHQYRNAQARDVERRLLIEGERVLTLYEMGVDDQRLFKIHPIAQRLMFLGTHNLVISISTLALVAWLSASIYILVFS